MNRWKRAEFWVATVDGPFKQEGMICGGLGLFERGVEFYSLTHLRSGLAICQLFCGERQAKAIAGQFLAVGDWTGTTRGVRRSLKTAAAALIDVTPQAVRFGTKCRPLTAREAARP
jgi:hypothetical protein